MSIRVRLANLLLLAMIATGLTLSQVAYRSLQGLPDAAKVMEIRVPINLTESDKVLIETRSDLSKWMLGIALALLPGLIIAKSEGGEVRYQRRVVPLLAGGALIVSIYGYYLSQESVIFVLSLGPPYHLYGPFFRFPVILQFWTLMIALVLLLMYWSSRPVVKLAISLVLIVPASTYSRSVSAEDVDQRMTSCAQAWSETRRFSVGEQQISKAGEIIASIARRAKIQNPGCDFAETQLDRLRWMAIQESSASPTKVFIETLSTVDDDLSHAGVGEGGALGELLKIGDIWLHPSGLLSVRAKFLTHILLDGKEVAVTDVVMRLSPGTYRLRAVRSGVSIGQDREVIINDGQADEVDVP